MAEQNSGEDAGIIHPLPGVPMPAFAVRLAVTAANTWRLPETGGVEVRLAYIATDSAMPLAFVSADAGPVLPKLLALGTRPARFEEMESGLVLEMVFAEPLLAGETLLLSFTQAGATIYYPPQPIDDGPAQGRIDP